MNAKMFAARFFTTALAILALNLVIRVMIEGFDAPDFSGRGPWVAIGIAAAISLLVTLGQASRSDAHGPR